MGRDAESAAQLATFIVASMESAILQRRVRRSIAPLDKVATKLQRIVAL